MPLKVLHSPYRELIRPIVDYAMEIKKANPRGVVAVYIPEYVVGAGGSSCCTTRPRCGSRAGCCSPPA